MPRPRKSNKDASLDDFMPVPMKISGAKSMKNASSDTVPQHDEIFSLQDGSGIMMDSSSGIKNAGTPSAATLKASINQLKNRIHELECERLLQQEVQKGTPKVIDEAGYKDPKDKVLSLKDILQQSEFVDEPYMLEGSAYSGKQIDTRDRAITKPFVKYLKSGYEMKSQEEVINHILWPHGFLNKLQNITDTNPDSLSMDAFMYGYASILLQMKDSQEQKGRLQHLQQVMWHSLNHGWKTARDFHYQVLRELEMGNISWDDQHDMLMFSLASAHEKQSRPGRAFINTSMRSAFKPKIEESVQDDCRDCSIFCFFFNHEPMGCRFEKTIDGCKKLHACSLCAIKGFYNKHRALDCRK